MYSVFERLLKEKGLKVSDVSRATGIGASTFTEWKKGLYTPKHDKLQKISDFLGVTVEFLSTGAEITMETEIIRHPCLKDLDFMDYVMRLWNLPPERKDPILRNIKFESEDYKKELREKDTQKRA